MAQPEVTFRHGQCSASIFATEHERPNGEKYTTRSVSFQRRYLDKDGCWQTTQCLGVNDLPKATLVLQKAYEYLTANGWNDEEKE